MRCQCCYSCSLASWIGWACAMGALQQAEGQTRLTITEGGQSEYRVLIPTEPCAEEAAAARELIRYLREATGAQLAVSEATSAPTGKFLLVGRAGSELIGPLLATPGIPALRDHEEAIVVATTGDDILITGRGPRAVLYAVYEFLETALARVS